MRNFNDPTYRSDRGLLVEGVYFKSFTDITQKFLNLSIHYWRTKSGAEVDFVLRKNDEHILPIEVKYRNLLIPQISRGYRSFLQAYQPPAAVIVTKNLIAIKQFENTIVHFIPLEKLEMVFPLILLL